jgi:triphosphoribosyl-dephospho-CoA synthase
MTKAAFLWACGLDVATRKPGNVSVAAPGHGMQAAMFIAAAHAAAPALFAEGARVGQRIEAAMRASLAAAGCNTNLGIVLLAAPLALAFEQAPPSQGPFDTSGRAVGERGPFGTSRRAVGERGPFDSTRDKPQALRSSVERVLNDLDVDDAAAAFRAITATNPGGLGHVQAHDVAAPATITLREAMVLAAGRDRIAHQYASGYDDVFGLGLDAWSRGLEMAQRLGLDRAGSARHAMLGAYFELLARVPDSHIARRHGDEAAHTVMAQTLAWRDAWIQGRLREDDAGLADWDAALKRTGTNPGTTADLCVATAFVAAWLDSSIVDRETSDPPDSNGHGS